MIFLNFQVGAAEMIGRVVDDLKDENEQYRKMVVETIEKIISNLGAADVDSRLEELLIDGVLYAFQEQTSEDAVSYTFLCFLSHEIYHSFSFLGHVEWFRHNRESAGQTCETLSASDLWYNPLASQQQVGQSATAGS